MIKNKSPFQTEHYKPNINYYIRIHFNGVGYCYAKETGQQLSKYYTTTNRLRKYGILFNV